MSHLRESVTNIFVRPLTQIYFEKNPKRDKTLEGAQPDPFKGTLTMTNGTIGVTNSCEQS